LFRLNSGCSAEQKILGIPFRTVPQRRKMFGILYYGTKLEANARNSVLNHSAEKKNNTEFRSQACLRRKHAVNSVCLRRIFCKKKHFFMPFPSVPSFVIDSSVKLGMPRNEHFLPRNNGSCAESIPRNFFDEIPLPTLAVINKISTNVSCTIFLKIFYCRIGCS
jgi:hypothetical protein